MVRWLRQLIFMFFVLLLLFAAFFLGQVLTLGGFFAYKPVSIFFEIEPERFSVQNDLYSTDFLKRLSSYYGNIDYNNMEDALLITRIKLETLPVMRRIVIYAAYKTITNQKSLSEFYSYLEFDEKVYMLSLQKNSSNYKYLKAKSELNVQKASAREKIVNIDLFY